jgi:GR25 family glycosyltransferase involved in LPS biosynthesis
MLRSPDRLTAGIPFFYISLNTSETGAARSRRLRRAFRGHTLVHVPAVDGNASAREYVQSEPRFHHLLKRNTPSEMGCSLSHVRAIQAADAYCASAGCDMAVVMEDDATADLLPLWTSSLDALASSLPDNWAVVQLQLIAQEREWLAMMAEWRARPSMAIPHDRRSHFGTGAYLIHRCAPSRMLTASRSRAPRPPVTPLRLAPEPALWLRPLRR